MKTFLLIPFLVFLFSNSLLIAKCYSFRKVDSVKICIDGDSNADRRKAQELCKKIIGSECGGVGGYTGSCTKNESLRCYNSEGKEQKHIMVD
ncbi:MAG: hypothetical protein IPG24_05560 [Leptospiraceae bacterium]|nr:hypothetical protein [Leptospiraceae bacterium]